MFCDMMSHDAEEECGFLTDWHCRFPRSLYFR